MGLADRSLIKYLSTCGILANLCLFTSSFFGRTFHNTLPIILGSTVIMVGLGLSLTLDPAIPLFSRMFYWTKFWDGKPTWARPLYFFLFALLLVQFALIAFQGEPTAPFPVEGEPLTSANGQIVRIFTHAQQLYRAESFLRLWCILMLTNFYQLLMYSIFPLRAEQSRGTPC